jgi:hypothetical protein
MSNRAKSLASAVLDITAIKNSIALDFTHGKKYLTSPERGDREKTGARQRLRRVTLAWLGTILAEFGAIPRSEP